MKEAIVWERSMALGSSSGLITVHTWENLKITTLMEWVSINGLITEHIKVSGRLIRCMEMVFSPG